MRPYYYEEETGGPPQFRFGMGGMLWTPVVKYVIIITSLFFVAQLALRGNRREEYMLAVLGLIPAMVTKGWLWQLITYTLLHGGILHILINMFILWMAGTDVERALGTGRFLVLYVMSGIVAAVTTCIFDPYVPLVIGASGSVLGVLMAFGLLFPNRIILLWFIIPVPAKVLVFLLAIVDILNCWNGTNSQVACFAHIGGFAFGYLFIKTRPYWERYLAGVTAKMRSPQVEEDDEEVSLEDEVEMDRLLGKIKSDGLHSLTWREKRFLDRISRRLRNR